MKIKKLTLLVLILIFHSSKIFAQEIDSEKKTETAKFNKYSFGASTGIGFSLSVLANKNILPNSRILQNIGVKTYFPFEINIFGGYKFNKIIDSVCLQTKL
ncbi:MAG: hypothetical protein GY830_03355 [Bacteroidetes bacterium]|nr:hypothetical protein [Bacteroidota bacterium]